MPAIAKMSAPVWAAANKSIPEAAQLWQWIEEHAAIVYPAVALVIIGLIAGTLIASFRADELDGERKGQMRMQILEIMRRRLSGVSAEQIAAELQVDVLVAAKLLADLEADGLVDASRSSPIQYRLRSRAR